MFGAVAQFGASFGAVSLVDCRLHRGVVIIRIESDRKLVGLSTGGISDMLEMRREAEANPCGHPRGFRDLNPIYQAG